MEHLEVVLDRVGVARADRLGDLAVHELGERLRLDAYGVRAQAGGQLRGRERKSPTRMASELPQRALALGVPRRTSASSMTSSW